MIDFEERKKMNRDNIETAIDQAAIRLFEADLDAMTKQEMREELAAVQDRIAEDTAWAEALHAALK